ncbi:MAG: hypothetical protein EBX99_11200 [Acidimicrobiia bacterium]|nr:hypothetical protein [Acidimicrobiia bacterium]
MSFNHLTTDSCTYKRNLKENVSILGYVMNPMRYEHEHKCRHELGLVGGTGVSHITGNLVDFPGDCVKSDTVTDEPEVLCVVETASTFSNSVWNRWSIDVQELPSDWERSFQPQVVEPLLQIALHILLALRKRLMRTI